MYSLKTIDEEKKRAKGISTRIVPKKLTHQDYVCTLFQKTSTFEEQTQIMQKNHQLFTVKQNKKCLCPFDDERFLLSDGISSLACGHCDIQLQTSNEE